MRRADSRISRVYVPDAFTADATVSLPAAAAHHVAHVLRAGTGEQLTIFNQGCEFPATITRIDKTGVTVKLGSGVKVNRETPLDATLAQAISSGERMDITLQKAVELGVARVQPLFSERSIVKLDGERCAKRVAHWRQVMISACEQCGRNVIPELATPLPYAEWLGALRPAVEGELRILLAPEAKLRAADLPRPAQVTLLAGPEGGFSEPEAQLAQDFGFIRLRLGPRILRTETAALAALATMNTLWGDF